MSVRCADCKHCPENWREISQLPLCEHPEAKRIEGRIIWALYSEYDGHCKKLKNFESRKMKIQYEVGDHVFVSGEVASCEIKEIKECGLVLENMHGERSFRATADVEEVPTSTFKNAEIVKGELK